jgi:hypothetical protein
MISPEFQFLRRVYMSRERYNFILKLITVMLDYHDETIPLDTFVREVVQLGENMAVEEHEVLDVLYVNRPFDFAISHI